MTNVLASPSSRPVAVQVDALAMAFRSGVRAPVFSDLSFTVDSGAFLCIVGPNGAGKTTLLRILAGLEQPTCGSVHLTGPTGEAAVPCIMFQENDLFPWLTIRQNLALGRARSALSVAEYEKLTARWLREVGLTGREDVYPHQMSGGGRQRAALVRAFLSGAPVLLLDEPFAHLDPTARIHLQQVLLRLWSDTGRTIVLVTHDIQEAVTLGDRVLVLAGGASSRMVDVRAEAPRDPRVADEPRERPRDLREVDVRREGRRDPGEGLPFAAGSAAAELVTALRDAAEPTEDVPARSRIRQRGPSRLLYLMSPLLFVAVWEALARSGALDVRFFPAPDAVLAAAVALARTGELATHASASLWRFALGLGIGGCLGVLVGGLMGVNRWARGLLEPLVGLTYPLPKIAILPLLLVICGVGEAAKVVTLAIGALFLLLFSTLQGVDQVQEQYADTIRSLRLRGWDYYGRTLLQGSLIPILTGLRAAAGYCLVLLVAAEFTGTNAGVGFLVWRSWELFFIEPMYVGLALLAGGGFLLFFGLREVEARIPWRRDPSHRREFTS